MSSSKLSAIDQLIDRYLNYLLIEKGLSTKTLESYSRDMMRYHDFLRNNRVRRISECDTALILRHLIALRDTGLGARSRARHLVSIRGFYRFLVQEKLLKETMDFAKDIAAKLLQSMDVGQNIDIVV